MQRIDEQYKRWQRAKHRAVMRARAKRKRRNKIDKPSIDKKYDGIKLYAPEHLSLLEYREESLTFFNKALSAINTCKPNQKIYFDLKSVEYITPDAVMYLIAVVNNVKRARTMRIRCEGNLPSNPQAREVIERSGFYSYVRALKPSQTIIPDNQVQICCGTEADGPLAGAFCDFVAKGTNTDRLQTKRLYPMIMELMTNTCQHAYRDTSSIMDNRWYIYAENYAGTVSFVFLDTGVGIPTTIRLNFAEKVLQLLLNNKSDARFISSALKGDFRTETRLGHRGKGLPGIFEDSKTGNISGLTIISGRGACAVNDVCEIEERTSELPFEGTLFCWKYSKCKEEA